MRYAQEQAAIEVWLDALATTLLRAPAFAAALDELPRVLKGYAETQARGQQAYNKILKTVVQPAIAAEHEGTSTALWREAIAAALADPEHAALDKLLSTSAPNELTADRRSRGPGTEPEIVNVH